MTKKYGRNYTNTFPIYRMKDYELDVAIEDLEKRGYEMVERGVTEEERRKFDYHAKKCWALMRLKEVVEV